MNNKHVSVPAVLEEDLPPPPQKVFVFGTKFQKPLLENQVPAALRFTSCHSSSGTAQSLNIMSSDRSAWKSLQYSTLSQLISSKIHPFHHLYHYFFSHLSHWGWASTTHPSKSTSITYYILSRLNTHTPNWPQSTLPREAEVQSEHRIR